MAALAEEHKELSFTKGNENARVFPFKAEFTLDKDRSALHLAEQQLGSNASKSQVEYYAKLLLEINDKDGKPTSTVFKADSTIKLPGQTTDGGLTVLDENDRKTSWQDDSFLLQKADGSAHAAWSSGDEAKVISWSATDPDNNNEKTVTDKEQRIVNRTGS